METTTIAQTQARSGRGVPPFLQKLVQVTESCPPALGGWNEEGTQFVVTSSQFADVLSHHFRGSLQTFIRQLHFYSFQKKDGPNGVWRFSHPNFLRGRTDLLPLIERKANATTSTHTPTTTATTTLNRSQAAKTNSESTPASSTASPASTLPISMDQRLEQLEFQFMNRIVDLENQIKYLTSQLHLSSSPPPPPPPPTAPPVLVHSRSIGLDAIHDEIEREAAANAALTSSKRFQPFLEDHSSVTSGGDPVLGTPLLFENFDSWFSDTLSVQGGGNESAPGSPLGVKSTSLAGLPVEDTTTTTSSEECDGKVHIPPGFVLQPGVSPELLKSVGMVLQQICQLKSEGGVVGLKTLCDNRPHPSTLPRVEICPVTIGLLPLVRSQVDVPSTDLQVMKAIRTCYELWFAKRSSMNTGGCPNAVTQKS